MTRKPLRAVLLAAAALAVSAPPARAQSAAPPTAAPTMLPQLSVSAAAPTPTAAPTATPGAATTLSAHDIARGGIAEPLAALEQQAPGVSLGNAQGNAFQPNLTYRGYTASPLDGTPQGLAVYLDGVRFNQAFADSVNWDLLVQDAIASERLAAADPVFGLNALGGALDVRLKDGFGFQGGAAEIHGGSFATFGAGLQYGRRAGDTAAYVAADIVHSDGWRQLNSSDLRRAYGDIGWRGARGELHLDLLGADNSLNGPGTLPVEILGVDPTAVFTAPNLTVNRYGMVALRGHWYATDRLTVHALAYYSNFSQRIRNGNATDAAPCPADPTLLCTNTTTPLIAVGGAPIGAFAGAGPYSQLNLQAVDTNSFGAILRATGRFRLLGRRAHIGLGTSFDGGQTNFTASTLLGGAADRNGVFVGPGVSIAQPDGTIAPVRVAIATSAYGAWIDGAFDPLPRVTVSLAGRMNVATIGLADHQGTALDGQHAYARFNPGIGLTWRPHRGLALYASYVEANRVPTPSELSCASPTSPCTLANFFVGDPNLKQVVARTISVGLRGRWRPAAGARLRWTLDLFRAADSDDIMLASSATPGLDYFRNIGLTRRQGAAVGISLRTTRWFAWINYSYTEASFQTSLTLDSPLNPAADAAGQIHVVPGDRLPGVPAHRLNLGLRYHPAPDWTIGLAAVVASGQYLFGDEANLTAPTTPYVLLNADAAWRIRPWITLFAQARNLLDERYATYGTFSPTASVPTAIAPGASATRSLSPGPPLAVYGGIRVRF